ncbi:hypothetical protein [Rhizobium sp.]
MAKWTSKNIDGEFDAQVELNYSGPEMLLVDDRKKVAQFDDSESSFQIMLFGKDFKYDGNQMTAGVVNKIQFSTFEGDVFVEISDFAIKAKKLSFAINADEIGSLIGTILAKNDKIIGTGGENVLNGAAGDDLIKGKGGDDFITGGFGNDKVSGGGGSDTFVFTQGHGRDVITDFNLLADNIQLSAADLDDYAFVRAKGGDAKLVFDDGSSILLQGIKLSQADDVHITAIL